MTATHESITTIGSTTHVSAYSRHIGRVGALAAALGIGLMVATSPGVASADSHPTTTSPEAGADKTDGVIEYGRSWRRHWHHRRRNRHGSEHDGIVESQARAPRRLPVPLRPRPRTRRRPARPLRAFRLHLASPISANSIKFWTEGHHTRIGRAEAADQCQTTNRRRSRCTGGERSASCFRTREPG